MTTHEYRSRLVWTGNLGDGTATPRAYARSHEIEFNGKPRLLCSSDSSFRGDPSRHNPEELLVAALSGCHMLGYLFLCAQAGVVVTAYEDHAMGTMIEEPDGGGAFHEVVLRPRVVVAYAATLEVAAAQHEPAHALCFIARSVNFSVRHTPTFEAEDR